MSNLTNKTILITGANRGIGNALLHEALQLDPKKVYATARDINTIQNSDERITKISLDLTDESSRQDLAKLKDIDIVIHNAGVLSMDGKTGAADANIQVNYIGTRETNEVLIDSMNTGGSIAFVTSVLAFAPAAMAKEYSASKAALASYSQTLRQELKSENISVHTIYPAATDTDMIKSFKMPKADPAATAHNIIQGILNGDEQILPDEAASKAWEAFRKD